ncbi:hypothetical protein KVF89_01350 [Nocardioides carbamazepini]|uniref:hypothetical protein n=1 Tax=Nocardioides carbamazepini TaxID=2854259 RepID=UPI00214A5997|nr:hypothetical protein [Nocardioides carbamazepini]MCR1781167.1 hypothetical protein [Nocardioides carbamazepini]
MGIQHRYQPRRTGLFVLAAALVVSATQAAGPASARVTAEDPPTDTILIQTNPLVASTSVPPLTVNENIGTGTITVTNPGGTAPTTQQCVQGVTDVSFCLGTSDQLVYPDDTELGPITITDAPTQDSGLPGSDLDWIIDDAVSSVARTHGVRADDLVRSYARPEIRAFVAMRINSILDKKLYGEPMSPQEDRAYVALAEIYKARLVAKSKRALREYDLWSANPCGYPVPAPPPGLPYVANEVAASPACLPNQLVQAFKLINNTPPVEVFDAWASYRNPSPLVAHGSDPEVVRMLGDTMDNYVTLGSLGAALAVGGATGATITALNLALIHIWYCEASSNGVITWTLASGGVASVVAAVVIAALVAAIAIWKIVEDAKPGIELRRRVTESIANNDPFGIAASQADYAGLDYDSPDGPEDPADAGKKALIHQEDFNRQLASNTYEWMMFDGDGELVPDPLTGWNEAGTTTEGDLKLVDDGTGTPVEPLVVLAPDGTRDHTGKQVSGYRVKVARGWLLVSTQYLGEAPSNVYEPRTSLRYRTPSGGSAMVSLWRDLNPEGSAKTRFVHTRPLAAGEDPIVEGASFEPTVSDTWTTSSIGFSPRTVRLDAAAAEPVVPPVSVVPSAQGSMVAGTDVRLKANLSDTSDGSGTYAWTIQRLDESGAVAQIIAMPGNVPPNSSGFPVKLSAPGRYRAIVDYTDTSPVQHASGRVEFTVLPPEPEITGTSAGDPPTVRDDRVLDGSLSLDLRMKQNTPSDTFVVEVEWADDARGHKVVQTYDVQCVDTGSNTCDTGPLPVPAPGAPPTNPQWSASPTYRIPDDQNYLPQVTARITNGYGNTVTRVFPITGEHRPSYDDLTPSAAMPVGTFTRVDLVEVFPSPLLTESQNLTILPYVSAIADQLPAGVHADIERRAGHWYLQLAGTPQADAVGAYTFYFPFEQEPIGKALRPAPALATLEIKAATEPGYRAVLRGTPSEFLDRQYRNAYPAYQVQVAQVLEDEEDEYGTFSGTVKCRLTAGPTVVFDKQCAANAPFPWPTELYSDTLVASTYLESGSQPLSADGAYTVDLGTRFVDPVLTQVAAPAGKVRFGLSLRDRDAVLPPYNGYQVLCSVDSGVYAACFADGTLTLPLQVGVHRLDVRVVAPDQAVGTAQATWQVAVPAGPVKVKTPHKAKRRGAKVLVRATGLLPGERFVVRIDGVRVGTGTVSATGAVRAKVRIPRRADLGKVKVVVRGTSSIRKGTSTVRVVR